MGILSSDIYDIQNFVNDIKKQHINESENTLSMGIFGYLGSTFSSMIQNNIIIGTEYINEMFPSRAKYEKSILQHAMTLNITDINAVPSMMDVNIALAKSEIDSMMIQNVFTIDKDSKIYIENFEFHLEYNIIITKSVLSTAETVYTARYAIDRDNPLSNVTNPYLPPPAIVSLNDESFIIIKCHIRQLELATVYKKIITDNTIDNKTFIFNFENQLANFDLKITEGNETFYVTPLFEGASSDDVSGYYCYYAYISSDTIKVTFNNDVYEPSLNADIEIIINTTQGADGNFVYNTNIITSLESTKYSYTNLSTMIIPLSEATYGVNRKSVEELKRIIPGEALSRGSITSNTDLENFFNSIDSDVNKLKFIKKADNQLERIYYSYLLLKDEYDIVIPTNTINLRLKLTDFSSTENDRLILKPGSFIGYNAGMEYGVVVPESELTVVNGIITSATYKFIYSIPFLCVVNKSPLYTSFYLNIINRNYGLNFDYINDKSDIQFISTSITLKRKMNVEKDTYKLNIQASQNIQSDKGLVTLDEAGNIISSKVKIIALLYNEQGRKKGKFANNHQFSVNK